jgi:RNA polymerase sigma-70 factor (ECF subfamily)
MPKTDPELVAATLAGDQDAFGEIVRRYQRLVFNAVYHYLGRHQDIEDLAQEVFLKVYRSLDRYDRGRPLQAWIFRIAANQCLDEIRKARHRRVTAFADLGEEEEERAKRLFDKSAQGASLTPPEQTESFDRIPKLMNGLSPRDRMAFVLREFEGLAYAQVAHALKTSETAVRIRVSRVKKRLQGQLSGLLGGRRGGGI